MGEEREGLDENMRYIMSEEEKENLIKRVNEFQSWLREFLKESGFIDLVGELRSRMGLDIRDMMCVESARDYER